MSSMLIIGPVDPEPLPLYRPRGAADPDTISIHSNAPSYVSETPTYVSTVPEITTGNNDSNSSTNQPRIGLPPARYAPGFQSCAASQLSGRNADPNIHNYNIGTWSSVNSSHASRQYRNVAKRRASASACLSSAALLSSMTTTAAPPTIHEEASSSTAGPSTNNAASSSSTDMIVTTPMSPLEDPYLVGEAAANRARQQRIYREMCLRGEDALRHEDKSWRFMLAQMADWEERDRSWKKFRSEVGRTKLLGRRLGRR